MKNAFRQITLLLVGALLALSVGCSKKTIIPDSDLERITREMFLVNAYATAEKVHTDSLDIYTPILERYGYTQDDYFNTLANFSKRKSARLGDVIEATIKSLEGLADGYTRKLRNLDYIDSLAKAQCSKEVLWREKIAVRRFKDTVRLQLVLPVRDEGEYVVSFNYLIDTLDKNLRLQTNHEVYNGDGVRTFYNRTNLTRAERKSFTTTIKPKRGDVEYRLTLADYAHREDDPHITFDSLRIVYLPPAHEALARMDSVMRFRPLIYFNDSIRVRGYLDARPPRLPHDTVWLRIDSLDMVRMNALREGADSLQGESDKLQKEVEKLLQRGEKLRTAASKKWFRNDSLRQVAHLRNVAQADSLTHLADSLTAQSQTLLDEALAERTVADSIEIVLWGSLATNNENQN